MINPNLDPHAERLSLSEKEIEKVIRPGGFSDFAGQEQVVENLKIFVRAANHAGRCDRQRDGREHAHHIRPCH